jgi:Tfp pilus assembly protein PilO
MRNKLLLVLAALLVIYIYFVKPKADEIPLIYQQAELLKINVSKEKYLHDNSADLEKVLADSDEIFAENMAMLFPQDMEDSLVFNGMQQSVKLAASSAGCDFQRGVWGEALPKGDYSVFPMRIQLACSPEGVSAVLNNIASGGSLYGIDSLTLGKNTRKKEIQVQLSLNGFRLNREQGER